MPSRIETALARGLAAIKSVAGIPITYTRGADSIEIEQAIRGSSSATVETSENQRLQAVRRDYLIDAADLDFGAGATEPRIGDEITDGTAVWEVTPLGDNEKPWRWHDPARTRYRIHVVEA